MTIFNSYVSLPEGIAHIAKAWAVKHACLFDMLVIENLATSYHFMRSYTSWQASSWILSTSHDLLNPIAM
jgi:hypothetical protein